METTISGSRLTGFALGPRGYFSGMYIGIGTIVLVLVIAVVVMLARRA